MQGESEQLPPDFGDLDLEQAPWMIVGLGNPGRRYEGTRHNLGFRVVSLLIRSDRGREAHRSMVPVGVWEGKLGESRAVFVQPQTYMNLSGAAVFQAAEEYRVPAQRLLVICDDLSLPPGKVRVRRKGSSGGHKGLQSIIGSLGTDAFARLRIGIGDPGQQDAEDYVLAPFTDDEAPLVEEAVDRAARAAEILVVHGIEEAMSQFNG